MNEGMHSLTTITTTISLFLFVVSVWSVEYQSFPSLQWQPAKFEESTIEQFLNTQFHTFCENVKTTDCQATLKRLLTEGPPIYIHDKHAMPLYDPIHDTHICKLWFQRDNVETSAKLDGALEGAERQKLWDELKAFIVVDGKEAGDDDENDDENNNHL